MKIDRLMGILIALLQNERVTAPGLAEKFEVSRRTINRDIEALCMAGVPVITHRGGSGGISISDGYKLDKSILTAGELSHIITALKGLDSVTPDATVKTALEKFTSGNDSVFSLKENIVINLASHYKGSLSPKIEQLKNAISGSRIIEFDYYNEKGEQRRRIEPYFIAFQWTSWYVFGYCLDRSDWRMFKLMRLWNLETTAEIYKPRNIPPERQDLDSGFKDNIMLEILFDKSVKYQLIESYGLGCYTEEKDGRLRLEIGYTNREYVISWLMGFGDRAEVIKPDDIKNEIINISNRILKRYQNKLK